MIESDDLRTAAYEYERRIAELESLVRDMRSMLVERVDRREMQDLTERLKALGLEG